MSRSSAASLRVSTRTPLDDPTLRMSLPSSASSLSNRPLSAGLSLGDSGSDSGLSPSSTGRPAKLGFRNMARKASAMTAASAPEMRAASLTRDVVDAPSCISGETGRGCEVVAPYADAVTGDVGSPVSALRIIGVAEPIDPRWESVLFRRLRKRLIMKKARMPLARSARKPSTTITAIAQWGNEELAADWTFPLPGPPEPEGFTAVPVLVEPPSPPAWDRREADEAEAADADEAEAANADDRDAADADDAAAAADVDDIDAITESAKVVWRAVNMGKRETLPSRVLSDLTMAHWKRKGISVPFHSFPRSPHQESFTSVFHQPAESVGLVTSFHCSIIWLCAGSCSVALKR